MWALRISGENKGCMTGPKLGTLDVGTAGRGAGFRFLGLQVLCRSLGICGL